MTAAFTVLLPHKRNPGNDRALAIALDCLAANTRHDFILLMDAAADQPLFPRINAMIRQATTDCVVYFCSDIFAAPDWDTPMLDAWDANTFVTGVLVEPGIMSPHSDNVARDFGRRPVAFRRAEFEAWATSGEANVPSGIGFPAPYMFSRQRVLDLGELKTNLSPDHQGFSGADMELFAEHERHGGQIVRARAFFYHLQRYSEVSEQTKEGR